MRESSGERSCCAAPRTAHEIEGAPPLGVVGGEHPFTQTRPVAPSKSAHQASPHAQQHGERRHHIEQCIVPAGTFSMGNHSQDGYAADGETPVHKVRLSSFEIDATSVTNEQFALFIDDTGYVTEAERYGVSAVFHLLVSARTEDILGPTPNLPWWISVRGADWLHPFGRESGIEHILDHPVVHVSWNDANAYCEWTGRRLPTEAEWEYASRGGIDGAKFPWGDEPINQEETHDFRANVWQGTFPAHNTAADGWVATAPVKSFSPNGFGLWQSVGNVWEWCADWFDPGYYAVSEIANPAGPNAGEARVLRGGSYLCHPSYCNRYRNSARSHNTPESSMGNAGFRTVRGL